MKNKIYRSLAKETYSEKIIHHFKTLRAPTNIPYLVDNIWEWLRPENMPSRRTAVYASPKKELALMYATSDDYLCSVEFEKQATVVQITNYQDAKLHQEVKSIPKMILQNFGQVWLERELKAKEELGRLFIPLLSKDEVSEILSHHLLINNLRERLIEHSTFWNDISFVDDGYKLTDGELFFYAKDGYYLKVQDKE